MYVSSLFSEGHNQRGRKKYRRRSSTSGRDMLESDKKASHVDNSSEDHTLSTESISYIDRETKSEAYKAHMKNVIENGIQETRRPSSAQGSKKDSLRARYWSYLFDNLQRAVDEIYKTCDNDESTVECEVSCSNYVMEYLGYQPAMLLLNLVAT